MSTPAPASRAAIGFILVAVILDTLAFGVMLPVLPSLLIELQGGDVAGAAAMLGLFGTVWAVMQFIASPVLGSLSDRFGRRPVILINMAALSLDYVLMALAPNVLWLFIGRVLSGITTAGFATATAYIADITPPEDRAKRFGLVGAAWGFGFIVGPAVGGFLAGFDLRAPFWVSAGLCVLAVMYGLFVLPESLPKDKRSPFHWRKANIVGSLRLLRATPALLGMAAAMFFIRLGHDVNPVLAVIYAQHRYAWSEQGVGFMLGAVGISSMIVQALLIGPTVKRLGERGALGLGIGFGALSFVIYAFAPEGWMFIAGIPLGALFGLAGPAIQGLVSRNAGASEQGQVQGALSSVTAVATMAAPLLFTQTFTLGLALSVPGLPYLLAAVCLIAALALGLRATDKARA
ncbi:MAG: TCR/Tet family MFS transporter [Rhodospirillaceae bacterium]|nr:TCR/Tet family MFS transporter [Rhodospirillaceae bacterium]